MHLRDKVFTLAGLLIGVSGILATIFWSMEAGIVALLTLSLLNLVLVMLQRKQMAKMQQRTLSILRIQQSEKSVGEVAPLNASQMNSLQNLPVYTKKIIGLLQAQQISMDVLNQKVEHAMEQNTSNHSSF